MIYTGAAWEDLCTRNMSASTTEDYFIVKNGIPYLPSNDNYPAGLPETGSIYYSVANNATMIYNGTDWTKLANISNSIFAESPGFSTAFGMKTCKLPVLNFDPSPIGLSAGAFYINLTLSAIRFYDGTAWNEISCGPILTTAEISDIKINTAVSGGNVISTSGSTITVMGICWSLSSNPDITLSTKTVQLPVGDGVGVFSSQLTGLLPNTTYHVRAYANSTAGTSYGEDKIFITDYSIPTIITSEASSIESTTAISGGDIQSNGGAPITARGIRWGTNPDPNNDPNAIKTDDGSGVGIFSTTLTGLLENTVYYIRAYAVNGHGTAYGTTVQFTSPPATIPLLSSSDINITNITDISASGEASILNNGGSLVTERGISWSTDRTNIQYAISDSENATDIGGFTTKLVGLSSGTTYFVHAYAKNKVGIAFGPETSFITASYVTLTTAPPFNITGKSASSGGMISNTGQAQITSRGVCWNVDPYPTTVLSTKTTELVTGAGTGSFASDFSGLTPGTKYYIRAYAINTHGTSYGNLDSLITLDYPSLTTIPVTSLIDNTALSGGVISNDGGSKVNYRGVCWSTLVDPSIVDSHTDNGSESGTFTSQLLDILPNTIYHVRAYATNSVGTSYGDDLVFTLVTEIPTVQSMATSDITNISVSAGGKIIKNGGSSINSRGLRLSTLPDPAGDPLARITENGTGDGEFTGNLINLLGNTAYFIQAYAVNSSGTGYGSVEEFLTLPPTAPVLSSVAPIIYGISNNSALSTFTILNNGGALVTERGIRWTTDKVNYQISISPNATSTDIGSFNASLKDLTLGTTYFAQTYATNSEGTTYSPEVTFTTTTYTSLTTLSTTVVSRITGVSAVSGGYVINNGDAMITSRGVIWSSLVENPTIDLSTKSIEIVSGDGIGSFVSAITDLSPGTLYYVVAYAVNSHGTAYGNVVSMITPDYLVLTTNPISSLTSNSVITGGDISFDGGAYVTNRGVCWSTMAHPFVSDNHTDNGTGSGVFSSSITALTGSTKYYIRAYAINSAGTVYGNELSLNTAPAVLASLTTTPVSNVGGVVATGGGNILNDGGASVTNKGVCWSISPNPTIAGSHTFSGSGRGEFTDILSGLTPGTKYYYKAYAINSVGLVYGNEEIFSTFTTPTVTTTDVTSITNISASSGGTIDFDGGTKVINSGICWNTTGTPNLDNSHTTSDIGTGSFIHLLTNLLGSKTYFVRAYAINNAGLSYGNEVTFTTIAPVIPTLTTISAKSGTSGTTGFSGGSVSSNGGALVTTRGVCWGINAGFDPETESLNKTTQTGTDNFTSTLTGLIPGTTYYVRAYATNSAGNAYASNEVLFTTVTQPTVTTTVPELSSITRNSAICGGNVFSDGGIQILSSGICWSSTISKPTLNDDYISIAIPATGSFLQTITGLLGSTTYFVRAYATNSAGTAYGTTVVITTLPPVTASLTTKTPTSSSASTAVSGGDITDDGGGLVSTRGIFWSTNANFDPDAVTTNKTAQTGYYKGSFDATLIDLKPLTVYYVKAYVINNAGISYGNEVNFITPSLSTVSTIYASSVNSNNAVSGGNITSDGGSTVSTRGVVWSTILDFVPDLLSNSKTSDGYGSGTYSSKLTGLIGNTIYYVRSYATNIMGTQFGNQLSFTTNPPDIATLVTSAASSISGTNVVSGGYISSNGGASVSTCGVVWSLLENFDAATELINRTAQTGTGYGSFTCMLKGLAEGTKYYMKAYATNSSGTAYGNKLNFTTLTVPTLTTILPLLSSTGAMASSGGNIISDGGASITNLGVCWSTSTGPTTGLYTKTSNDTNTGTGFVSKLTSLTPITTYYLRAYAVNGQGTAYGNEVSFITPPAVATLTTNVISVTSESTASCGGEITSNGGALISSRGVKWSTDPTFNPDDITTDQTVDGSGSGTFTSNLSGLKISITYYVRAYAVNSAGTAYGNQVDVVIFPTSPILNTNPVTAITGIGAGSGGDIVRNGGAEVTVRGIVWDILHNPTVGLDTKTVDEITRGNGTFNAGLSGLQPNTQYYVRSYATNKIGTAYGLEVPFLTSALPTLTATNPVTDIVASGATSGGLITDDGRSSVIERGICWNTISSPTIANDKTIDVSSNSISTITGSLTGLKPSTRYYVRAYATNGVGTSYGSEVFFETAEVMLPTLTTSSANSITSTLANIGGVITDNGGMPVTARGICWSITESVVLTTALTTTIYNSTGGNGDFVNTISGLIPATLYYVRAFAINSLGTAYGEVKSFTTLPAIPTLSLIKITNSTMTTAEATATVTDNGGGALTDRGLYWNTTGIQPGTTDNSISNGYIGTSISGILKNLIQSTKYYVWAYATNSAGTGYSKTPISFYTLSIATLTTTKPTLVTRTSVRTGGNITSSGGAVITDRGVCWSNTLPAVISNNRVSNGPGLTGVFVTDILDLVEGTKYYIRAYAVSDLGVDYGNLDSLTTLTTAAVSTSPVVIIASITASCGGVVSSDGGVPVTARGVCWSITIPPTIDLPGTFKTTNGTGIGSFVSAITGLAPVTTYYVRAYATSAQGTSYGNLQVFKTLPVHPTVSNVMISTLTNTVAEGSASVTEDGGDQVTSRGVCWNTKGNPVTTDNIFDGGAGTGDFSGELTGLVEGVTYYARAFATNSGGTGYSPLVNSFKICPSFTVIHTAGLNGAPITKTIKYGSVGTNISGSIACWITQNLGAEHSATSVTDDTEASAGWYWQFNHSQGYMFDGTTYIPSNGWTSWTTGFSEYNTGWSAANDPCVLLLSSGWHVPTSSDWTSADASPQNWNTAIDAYASVLKLHPAGYIAYNTGILTNRGTSGNYWSSNYSDSYSSGWALNLGSGSSMAGQNKASGFPLRCIRDGVVVNRPSVSNVTVPTSSMTSTSAEGIATVTPSGGATVTSRGLCWNTTGTPTIEDNPTPNGSGTGVFKTVLTGLMEGPTYYVRAYAINSAGTVYSPTITAFKLCPPTFTMIHTAGLNGAPVTKTVEYHTMSTNVSGAAACWLTQNLGADHEALSSTDDSEISAGWYWQFNRAQGYKFDEDTYTPSDDWATWTTSISEYNTGWTAANDPCNLMLSSGWRIPTKTEWENADAQPQFWQTAIDTYASVLKLHPAGYVAYNTGVLTNRGTSGNYWSSNYSDSYASGWSLKFGSSSYMVGQNKASGFSLRCIRDGVVVNKPSVSNVTVPTSSMSMTSAEGTATVTPDGGGTITDRGFCWNATGNPTIEDITASAGKGTGTFSLTLKGLKEGITYYLRAYARNSAGLVYSPEITTFKLCPPTFTLIHTAGLNGAPVTKTVTYHTVSTNISKTAACWLTQNLGADQEALSSTDNSEASAGWYWQFNRAQGYKFDGDTYTPSNGWTDWNTGISEYNTGWAAANDPCSLMLSSGWRIPTKTEWENADAQPQFWQTAVDTYASVLKLHPAGYVAYYSGVLTNRGTSGNYWSSTYSDSYANAWSLNIGSGSSMLSQNKASGFSLRCIRDGVVASMPSVSVVLVPTASMGTTSALGTSTVTPDGGAKVTARGLCWNTTGSPTIEDRSVLAGSGTGTFTSSITGLIEGPTYYVRAFATNSAGTAYSLVSSFKICPTTFSVIHTAGLNGAPVTKTVTYHSVSSNISNAAACWLTQNLGADQEALSSIDDSEASAGWFWQFNRAQGYKYDGIFRTPSIAWDTSISEYNTSWGAASDPCRLLLSSGWRIPTNAEWTAADYQPQFWQSAVDTYASVLKLHPAGYIASNSGLLINRGTSGNYWSCNYADSYVNGLSLNLGSGSSIAAANKANGFSLRCIRDAFVVSRPSVSNVTVSTSSMTATTADVKATVTPDGGAKVTVRGLCWNTTGTPTVEDNPTPNGTGTGEFSTTLNGLTVGPTYYVRAYAINSAGTTYSPLVTSFKIVVP